MATPPPHAEPATTPTPTTPTTPMTPQPPTTPSSPTQRLLRPDGSHSVRRIGLDQRWYGDVYHYLMLTSWWQLLGLIVGLNLAVNALFGIGFFLDPGGIENARPGSFTDAYFFSVQTLATVGYGKMAPISTFAHVLVTIEAIVGMLIVAVSTGIIFAKFSRPTARVLFSAVATIHVREGKPSLVFRMANARSNHIVDANLRCVIMKNDLTAEGEPVRRVLDLSLQRSQNSVFTLSWMAIHVIDSASPLFGLTLADYARLRIEIMASIVGIDGTMSQTVHARHAYSWGDLRLDEKFVDIFREDAEGRYLDYSRFHQTEPAITRLAG